jgi:hypothetical protein
MELQWLLRELDPKHDFDRLVYDTSLAGSLRYINTNILNMAKSVVRGAAVGTVLGGAAGIGSGLITGKDLSKGALDGAVMCGFIGLHVDISQYALRYYGRLIVKSVRNFIDDNEDESF